MSAAGGCPVAAALVRCGPLFRRSVLFVDAGEGPSAEALRLARGEGAHVTAFCPPERAAEARDAGAEVVLDPGRTDPTWYRGAWSVIVDPAGAIGFRRASGSLGPGGVYITSQVAAGDRLRAAVARLSGRSRLLRLRKGAALALVLLVSVPPSLAAPPGRSTLVLHVDDDAHPGGDGTGSRPFQDVGDAVAAARDRVAWHSKILISIAPGRYPVPATLRIDFPVRLHGGNVPELDADGWPLGTVRPDTETTLEATGCSVDGGTARPLVLVGGAGGNGVSDVSLTSVTLQGFSGCPVLQVQRAQRFAVTDTIVRGTPPGVARARATLGIDVAASSGVVARNHVSGVQGCGICVGGGTSASPASVTATDNRSVDNNGGGLLLGGSAVPVAGSGARLDARVVHNDLSLNQGTAPGSGLRVVAIQPIGPDDEPRGQVTALIADNRVANNRHGLMVDAGFPVRNSRTSGCDARTFSGRLDLRLRGNTLTGSLQRAALVTFTRGQVFTNGNPLRDWQYLHEATFTIDDPDLTLGGSLFDHPESDPFVNDGRNGGTCAADEASEPLSNVLIYNDEELPPQP
jgi:hypothetical protein